MKVSDIGEFGLIDKIAETVSGAAGNAVVGIGDDAAVIRSNSDHLTLLSTDAFVEGVHFDLAYFSFYQLGWRVLAATVSDIAAMGGVPTCAVFSLALPQAMNSEDVEAFYRGSAALAALVGTEIVGGDIVASTGGLFISISVMGEVAARHLKLRSNAHDEDAILVTGTPGRSHAGLRILTSRPETAERYEGVVASHRTPQPRVDFVRFLTANFELHAMIDLSDGLASEIHHICHQSGVGARVYRPSLLPDRQTTEVAKLLGEDAFDYVMFGGEDFELLFTAPSESAPAIVSQAAAEFGLRVSKIGEISGGATGVRLYQDAETWQELPRKGFDHFPAG